MRKIIKHSNKNYRMPVYMQEILVNNFCPHFVRMSIVRGDDRWIFSYGINGLSPIDYGKLNTLDKLNLIQTLYMIKDKCADWLINAEEYLIEPEMIYSENNAVVLERVKIAFYPDYEKNGFNTKVINFIEKIKDRKNKLEVDIMDQVLTSVKAREEIKTRQLLEKNILRLKRETEYRHAI